MSRLGRLVAIARSVGCKTAFSQSLDAQVILFGRSECLGFPFSL